MFDSLFTRYPLFRYIPTFLCLAILFRTSAIPGTGMTWLVPPYDKLMHCFAYTMVGISLCLWFKNNTWDTHKFRTALIVILCVVLCGVADEFHQSFVPGRTVSVTDLCADLVGGILASGLYLAIKPWKRFRFFK